MAWSPLKTPFDYVVFCGTPTPGLADVIGLGSPRRIDKRLGYGLSGSFPVFLGKDLAEFQVRIRLYTQQDWDDWDAFAPIVLRLPQPAPNNWLTVQHPYLAMLKITAVIVKNVSQPEEIDDGAHAITIDLIEFRRPRTTLAKPDAAADAPITDPVDQDIRDALNRVDVLAH